MNEIFSLPQILGYFALLTAIIGMVQTNDIKLKAWMTFGYALLASHYLMLNSVVTACTLIVGVVRNLVSIRYSSLWVALIFAAIYSIVGISVMSKSVDLLPVIGAVINTMAIVTLKGIKMRLVLIFSCFFGISNAVIIGSIGGIAIESMLLFLGVMTIYRMIKSERLTSSPS
ncbi:YgjV family protein [Enterovibrio calviensis]|uniref:YgjV family protein n=1 Tax=Enterovibrio calviensis TaxID=91359 RepID=UPI000485FFE4|nr:YgjV family protein [Enterovibrio calviensis]